MIQYIDKSTLVARVKKLKMDIGNIFNEYDEGFWEGRATAFDDIICALDTIEVKEIDLDFMLHEYWNLSSKITIDCLESATMTKDEMINFAKHFFELGLKAKME